jgi:hypothetical protein
MAGRFFGVRRSDPWGRRRASSKGRVLIGLLPFYAMGGFVLFQGMSGGAEGPIYAGSAVAASDPQMMTEVSRAPVAATVPVEKPATFAAGHSDEARKDGTSSAEKGTTVVATVRDAPVPPARPPGWRLAPGSDGRAGEGSATAGELVAEQPKWRPERAENSEPAAVPMPRPRPDRLGTDAAESNLAEDGSAAVPRSRSAEAQVPSALPSEAVELAGDARVVIHFPSGPAAEEAHALLAAMDAQGINGAELRRVPIHVAEANVRFFHPQDRAAAESVNRLMRGTGYPSEVEDFTSFDPPPSRGTVEVWLPG